MGYLAPPPMPAPVIVTKDVGGFVADYQAQTEIYRATGREVRLHECRSACTLALSLPNVCVYPTSVLKFHKAYDPRSREANDQVSQQLFQSYPAAVRARLGTLTRSYRVLRGSELIALGIRNCNEPRVMVATAAPRRDAMRRGKGAAVEPASQVSGFDDLMQNVLGVFSQFGTAPAEQPAQRPARPLNPAPATLLAARAPLPPTRPADLKEPESPAGMPIDPALEGITAAETIPEPPRSSTLRSLSADLAPARSLTVISGAQAILPARFTPFWISRRSSGSAAQEGLALRSLKKPNALMTHDGAVRM